MESEILLKKARDQKKPTSREFFHHIFSDFQELHGDRLYADDGAVVGGLAFLKDLPVTVIGLEKGHDLRENLKTNFGQAHPEGYRKALRLMKQAEKFQRPIITFINTAGAFCGIGAEERGQGAAIADNLVFLSQCQVPVIAILIGEGGSGGALALGVADEVWALENTFYAILSPEGFASILWKDATKANEAADVMQLAPEFLKKQGIIEKIIPETKEDQTLNVSQISLNLEEKLLSKIKKLQALDVEELLEKRYQRFRKF